MDILLDTNIVLIYGRDNDVSKEIESQYNLFATDNRIVISIVTLGEINALIKKLDIGHLRNDRMQAIIQNSTISGIHYTELIEAYGDIDKLTSGKIKVVVNKNRNSATNMGKNDLWIAATAKSFDLTVVTTDKDFLYLADGIIDVLYIDIDEIRKSITEK